MIYNFSSPLASAVTNIARRAKYTAIPKTLTPEQEKNLLDKRDAGTLAKINFELRGFHKYGLLEDDLWNELEWDVEEAIRRIPLKMKQERDYRILRAIQANINNMVLPEELWTKVDDVSQYTRCVYVKY